MLVSYRDISQSISGILSMGNGIQRIERRLKLHDLRVLMSVVERGSMAKAAESLATSQPAISRAISMLGNFGVRRQAHRVGHGVRVRRAEATPPAAPHPDWRGC